MHNEAKSTSPNSKEKFFPLEVVVPPEIEQDLKQGVGRVMKLVKELQPDSLVVLQRSGPLALPAVEAYAASINTPLPPTIKTHIGREIAVRFVNQQAEKSREQGKDIFEEGPYRLADHQEEYYQWLKQDKDVSELVESLNRKKENPGYSPKKVLVVDDTCFEGETLNYTTPLILKQAFGQETKIKGEVVFRNSNYARRILEATLGPLSEDHEYFFRELMKGYLETETGLTPIVSEKELALLGRYTQEEKGLNPYPQLLKKYGKETLLSFPQKVITALKQTALKK